MKLTVALNAAMQVKKWSNQQEDSSYLLNCFSASWGAKSSGKSIGPTVRQGVEEGWGHGIVLLGVKLKLCASMACRKNREMSTRELSLSGKMEGVKGAIPQNVSPRLKVLWNKLQYWLTEWPVIVQQSRGHSPSNTKDGIAELLTAYVTSHFKHLWYWRTKGWLFFFF